MCGIGGVLRVWQSAGEAPPSTFDAIPESWLDVLDESVKHRGPDGQGRFRQRVVRASGEVVDVALIHRRLSIIDHAGGAQPMAIGIPTRPNPSPGLQSGVPSTSGAIGHPPTEVGGSESECLISREGAPYEPLRAHACPKCGPGVVAVVFNGCIYNHRELRRELEAAGHEFFTDHSDTEVLLHGWREWGVDVHGRLEGMFAFTIWDAMDCHLALARDSFGEKPLHGCELATDSDFAFGSNIIGLTMLRAAYRLPIVDGNDLVEWIRFGYDAEVGPIKGTLQVGHGDFLRTAEEARRSRGLRRDRKHAVQPDVRARIKRSLPTVDGMDELVTRVDRALSEAVAGRLEADVPLGCLLSGGVDSSLISHYASKHIDGELTTLCVRMHDDRYDESRYAQIAAEQLGSRHLTIDAAAYPAEDLVFLIRTLGLPFGDSSLLPTYWACRAAAGEVKVLLSGDGGDELFLGYERYEVLNAMGLLNVTPLRFVAGPLAATLPRKDPKSRSDKAARFLVAAAAPAGQAYRELLAIFPRRDSGRLFDTPRSRIDPIDAFTSGPLDARDYDLQNHLPGDMLRKVDAASMLAGIEVRAPFLDRSIADIVMVLPARRLMPRGQRKGLLRAVARKYLPAEIVDRPKMGFAIPIGEWFRTDYGGMRQLLYDHLESADPFPGLAEAGVEINMNFVRRMLREHDAAGERSINPWHGRDHSQRLYMLLVLSIWCGWLRGLRGEGPADSGR